MYKEEKILQEIDRFLPEAPEGCLKWQNKHGKTYYYHQYEENGKWKRRYIKKKDIELAKKLAQKQYCKEVRPLAKARLDRMKFLSEEKIETIYDQLSEERKVLVKPFQMSAKEILKRWEMESYEKSTVYEENLRFETDRGEFVRSKSEVIIANILYRHKDKILYKYERPLHLLVNGQEKIVYPDFTILNIETGRVVYWEHAGRMDDPYYARSFVKKMNTYRANGYQIGKDIILTFETQETPLEIGMVRKMVEGLIEKT